MVVDSTGAALFSTQRVLATGIGYYRNNASVAAAVYDIAAGSWTPTTLPPPPSGPVMGFAQTRLLTGSVLQAGGIGLLAPGTFFPPVLATASLFSPASLTFTPTASMSSSHAYHTMVTTFNGTALVLGGLNVGDETSDAAPTSKFSRATSLIEAYNPFTNTWSVAGNMASQRSAHVSVVLNDGRVLSTGGYDLNTFVPLSVKGFALASAELFDPVTGVSTGTRAMSQPRVGHSMVVLADGTVLACGGQTYNPPGPVSLFTCEIYNPSTGTWELTGNMTMRQAQTGGLFEPVPWVDFTLSLLPNGSVLASGPIPAQSCLQQFNVFNPQTRTWSETGPMPTFGGPQILLPTGELLLVYAFTSVAECNSSFTGPEHYLNFPTTAMLFNPATGALTPTGDAPTGFLEKAQLF